ncbi:hypothetical protein AGMMS4952_07120 [Spirochaetia bacterium]|nr:hypothetical protein AGMMS4952_07120 [Spirochaetia bacterium]
MADELDRVEKAPDTRNRLPVLYRAYEPNSLWLLSAAGNSGFQAARSPVPKVNQELLEKFRNGFIDIKEQIRKKAAEGYHFDFDVQKYLNGSMTEDDWQQFYKMEM